MSEAWKKAIMWWLTAAAAIAEAVLATLLAAGKIAAGPVWWGTGISVVVLVAGVLIGKPWTWPAQPPA
jgi:hypothetical protein